MSVNLLNNIKWLGHDGFEISTDDITLVIDPFQIESARKADIILITHSHYDHCSVEDIARCIKDSTVVITEPESAEKLSDATLGVDIKVIRPGGVEEAKGIQVEAVAAYNKDKKFHPKEKNWLGFVITINGERIYHAGDTDLIPEMTKMTADIVLLPVSGTYVMTAEEAAKAVTLIKPSIAIPMHYNSIIGTDEDAMKFKQALIGICDVFLPKRS